MIHIYAYENLINGKIYIGQTSNIERRDRSHISCDNSLPIDRAIKKYGRSNFSLNIITSSDSQDIANEDEIYWISRARELLGKKNVYNISDGGSAPMRNRKHSKKTKNRMSNSHKGIMHTDEEKRKIGQAHRGKTVSEETKTKIRVARAK